jgi:hypothetical protein
MMEHSKLLCNNSTMILLMLTHSNFTKLYYTTSTFQIFFSMMVGCMSNFLVPLEVILNIITSIHGVFLQGVSMRHCIHHQGQRKLNFIGYYLFLVFFHHKCNTHWDFLCVLQKRTTKRSPYNGVS